MGAYKFFLSQVHNTLDGGRHEYVPVQLVPSPTYPLLHAHSNDPGILEHVACV